MTRRLDLPVAEGTTEEDYDFEAPHHGIAMSADDKTLCLAGRISDYVALVDVESFELIATVGVGDAPSWATTSVDGRFCAVPNNRDDTLSIISYASATEVARLDVGAGPKFVEAAAVPDDIYRRWLDSGKGQAD